MTESSEGFKQTLSDISGLHVYGVLFGGWCPVSDILLADSTACTQRELDCEAESLRDSEPETRERVICIVVWLICSYAGVYKLLSLELEPHLAVLWQHRLIKQFDILGIHSFL